MTPSKVARIVVSLGDTLVEYLGGDLINAFNPGMSAAVEIKTGKRSVISFLLSPINKSLQTAGRER